MTSKNYGLDSVRPAADSLISIGDDFLPTSSKINKFSYHDLYILLQAVIDCYDATTCALRSLLFKA